MRYMWRVAPSSSTSCEDGWNGYSWPHRHCNNKVCSITKGVWSTYSSSTRSATRVPGRHAPNTETRNRKNTTGKESSSEGTKGDNIFQGVTTVEKAARSHVESRSFLVALSKTIEGKSNFRDLIRLRYLLPLENMPLTYVCGKDNTITQALTCATGGFILKRHNDVRDYLAHLLNEVCADVSIESHLVQVTEDETTSTNREDAARLDIATRDFWRPSQRAFFDIRVFNANAHSNISRNIGDFQPSCERKGTTILR